MRVSYPRWNYGIPIDVAGFNGFSAKYAVLEIEEKKESITKNVEISFATKLLNIQYSVVCLCVR